MDPTCTKLARVYTQPLGIKMSAEVSDAVWQLPAAELEGVWRTPHLTRIWNKDLYRQQGEKYDEVRLVNLKRREALAARSSTLETPSMDNAKVQDAFRAVREARLLFNQVEKSHKHSITIKEAFNISVERGSQPPKYEQMLQLLKEAAITAMTAGASEGTPQSTKPRHRHTRTGSSMIDYEMLERAVEAFSRHQRMSFVEMLLIYRDLDDCEVFEKVMV
ncbi:hypothetical protein CYMTET_53779 [Cymbomonas tetramitiformis]|uniref:Uncharacterized protein n=1 Tax=Cymbomonas tetramitiformis TaxID=36881 RepID=A0AAE0EPE0_9CHLO|nr:hypothetical protein CYMTET_53779 [Cymbomonas tetramitiformis]